MTKHPHPGRPHKAPTITKSFRIDQASFEQLKRLKFRFNKEVNEFIKQKSNELKNEV